MATYAIPPVKLEFFFFFFFSLLAKLGCMSLRSLFILSSQTFRNKIYLLPPFQFNLPD